jgi:hypothetical protein
MILKHSCGLLVLTFVLNERVDPVTALIASVYILDEQANSSMAYEILLYIGTLL